MTRAYEARVDIQASPERVWSILVDGTGWPTWDSGVDRVEGRIAAGEIVTIRSMASRCRWSRTASLRDTYITRRAGLARIRARATAALRSRASG